MNATNKFGITSVVMIILLSVGLSNHVLILPLLLDACRRDAWLSVIAAGLLASLFLLLPFFKVVRDLRGVRLDVWLKRRLSSFWASLIVWFFVLVQFVIAIITLAETAEWTASTYLPETPVIVVSVCLIVLCGFAAWSGLQSIAYVSCILLPIVVLLGDFVMSANLPQKDYRFLLPMLENGYWPVRDALCIQQLRRNVFVIAYSTAFQHARAPMAFGACDFGFDMADDRADYRRHYPIRAGRGGKIALSGFFAVAARPYRQIFGACRLFCDFPVVVRRIDSHIDPPLFDSRVWGFPDPPKKTVGLSVVCALLLAAAFIGYRNVFSIVEIERYYFQYIWIPVAFLILALWGASYKKQKNGADAA